MKRFKPVIISIISLIILLAYVAFYGFFIEPENLDVTHLWPENSVLKEKLKGKIAVHLSDVHIKQIGSLEKSLLKLINKVKPDFIFLTGDYVKWNGSYKPALAFLSQLKASDGMYAVMGDYDYSDSRKSCLFCHEEGTGRFTAQHPVKFLRKNKVDVLMTGGNLIGYEKNAKYDHGLFKEGKKMMYVSRGVGTSHIRFRLFRKPEVVVLHF